MKALERITRYGIKAYLRMRGLKASPTNIKFYTDKYVEAPVYIPPPSEGAVSRWMKSYWRDVKGIMAGRKLGTVKARKLMKKEGAGKKVFLRVIKAGKAWQLCIVGRFKDEREEQPDKTIEAFGKTHPEKDFDKGLEEAISYAQYLLGGSNWVLVELISYTWNRWFGREEESTQENIS